MEDLQKGDFAKTPHHLTFSSGMPVFTGVSESEVLSKDLTQHLT